MLHLVPGLMEARARHCREQGQVLPEALFGELLRWLIDDYENDTTGGEGRRPGWREAVAYLNDEFADREGELTRFIVDTIAEIVPTAEARGSTFVSFLFGQLRPPYHNFLPDPRYAPQRQLDLIHEIVRLIPTLSSLYEEHFDERNALTYPFFNDLTVWAVEDFEATRHDEAGSADWHRLLDLLERHYVEDPDDPDDDVMGLIHVAFVENLPYPWERGAAIVDELGPRLLDAMKTARGAMEICRRIGKAFPDLRQTYRGLFEQARPDVDPSADFLATTTRWACDDYLDSLAGHGRRPGWRELMDMFEREYAADGFMEERGLSEGEIADNIEEAVLAELPLPTEPAAGIRDHLGPYLAEGLKLFPAIALRDK